jgi:hypothetical protein
MVMFKDRVVLMLKGSFETTITACLFNKTLASYCYMYKKENELVFSNVMPDDAIKYEEEFLTFIQHLKDQGEV